MDTATEAIRDIRVTIKGGYSAPAQQNKNWIDADSAIRAACCYAYSNIVYDKNTIQVKCMEKYDRKLLNTIRDELKKEGVKTPFVVGYDVTNNILFVSPSDFIKIDDCICQKSFTPEERVIIDTVLEKFKVVEVPV